MGDSDDFEIDDMERGFYSEKEGNNKSMAKQIHLGYSLTKTLSIARELNEVAELLGFTNGNKKTYRDLNKQEQALVRMAYYVRKLHDDNRKLISKRERRGESLKEKNKEEIKEEEKKREKFERELANYTQQNQARNGVLQLENGGPNANAKKAAVFGVSLRNYRIMIEEAHKLEAEAAATRKAARKAREAAERKAEAARKEAELRKMARNLGMPLNAYLKIVKEGENAEEARKVRQAAELAKDVEAINKATAKASKNSLVPYQKGVPAAAAPAAAAAPNGPELKYHLDINNKDAWQGLFPKTILENVSKNLKELDTRIASIYVHYLGDESEMTKQEREGTKVVRNILETVTNRDTGYVGLGHEKCAGGGGAGGEPFCNWPVMVSLGAGNDCLVHSLLTATCPAFRRLREDAKLQVARAFRRRVMPTFRYERKKKAAVIERLNGTAMLQDEEYKAFGESYGINLLIFQSAYAPGPGSLITSPANAQITIEINNRADDAPTYMLALKQEVHFESVRTLDGNYTIPFEEANRIRDDPHTAVGCAYKEGDTVRIKGDTSPTVYYVIERITDIPPNCNKLHLGTKEQWEKFHPLNWTIKASKKVIDSHTTTIVNVSAVEHFPARRAENAGGAAGRAGGGRRRSPRHTRRRRITRRRARATRRHNRRA